MSPRVLITVLATCALVLSASAQTRNFVSSRGKQKVSISWNGSTVKTGTQTEYYTNDSQGKTIAWRLVDPSNGTDVSISLENGSYIISGSFKGEKLHKKEKSKGNPWYQKIEMNGLGLLKGKKDFKYECFGARDLKFYVMSASDEGEEKVEGIDARRIKSTLANGIFAGMWSCSFYFDVKTSDFMVYKSVEGAPGTPETTIICTDR